MGPNKFGFVALMGEPNVGKSSILNTILEKKLSIVSHKVQTTRFRLNGILCERELTCLDDGIECIGINSTCLPNGICDCGNIHDDEEDVEEVVGELVRLGNLCQGLL